MRWMHFIGASLAGEESPPNYSGTDHEECRIAFRRLGLPPARMAEELPLQGTIAKLRVTSSPAGGTHDGSTRGRAVCSHRDPPARSQSISRRLFGAVSRTRVHSLVRSLCRLSS